jgi:HAD superfamily hydrolase (TIGR01509 family)
MIKAVIFDLDGLMIDSEPIQSKAYEQILEQYNKQPILNKLGVVHSVGIKERKNWEILKKKYDLEEDTEILMEKRSKVYLDLLKRNIKPMKGLKEVITLLKKNNIKLAVASSSVIKHIDVVLLGLEIKEQFDVIMSAQFVRKGKPFPDIDLEAAKKLGVNPENCLVLEDAQSGVEAGKNAGMKVIAISNKFTKNHDLSKADLILNSLEEINLEIINSL